MGSAGISRQTGRIESLQALRALAFLGIFLRHANYPVSWAELGVSVFYVLSGFLMEYRYGDKELDASVKGNLSFSLKKIKKLYPLHIITMILMVFLSAEVIARSGADPQAVRGLIVQILLNITLLQTWVPDSNINVSLNGVAWYLSVTMFLYFVYPWIKKIIGRNTLRRLSLISAAILAAELLVCIPFIRHLGAGSPVYIWFMYCFPVFRLGDFFIGCVLKRLYFEGSSGKAGMLRGTAFEVSAFAVTVLVLLWLRKPQDNIILLALHNWTTVYIPLAAIWIALFAACSGLITKALSNRLLIYIGNLSAYAFLIHFVVIQYTIRFLPQLFPDSVGWNRSLIVLSELVFTLLLSVLYRRIHERR